MPKKPASEKQIESFVHDDASRRNIPPAEYQTMVRNQEKTPLQVAYERRNPDLDPQLIWRGKDLLDDSPLVVNAPPLYIQEKIHPKVLIDDLKRRSKQGGSDTEQIDLFSAFNGLPSEEAKTEFYQHDQNWSNRMILGDSLQVMASLAEREGLRGKVQCIYFDPPYGIKFNSNFQWSTTSRDVKDGREDHITREPEQVKAFRDTWKDGINSYLAYLRDRLMAAKDLMEGSGSIFVQIGDENVHRVRCVMDEIFGDANFVAQITVRVKSPLAVSDLARTTDFLLWYSKDKSLLKFRQPRIPKLLDNHPEFSQALLPTGATVSRASAASIPEARMFTAQNLASSGYTASCTYDFSVNGKTYLSPKGKSWKTHQIGMTRLAKAGRLQPLKTSLRWRYFYDDAATEVVTDIWSDMFAASEKTYVVQTSEAVIQRCILMTTDPGDLVLDPTCGSGTTAYVGEQWGRRWITIDTSRVALALARARIMGAKYPYYLLADSVDGKQKEAEVTNSTASLDSVAQSLRQGFVYERSPRITLKSIANNAEIDTIWETWQSTLAPLLEQLNTALGKAWQEWEVPQDVGPGWSDHAKILHANWWDARVARQKDIDASISAKADPEYIYDKPYENKSKIRVAGPFTVESLTPHRTLIVNDDDSLVDPHKGTSKNPERA